MYEWISVNDRLPDQFGHFVLVTRNKDCIATVEAQYKDGKFISHRFGIIMEFVNPTHWMEMPQPIEAECMPPNSFIDFHEQCNSGGAHHGQSGRFMEVV